MKNEPTIAYNHLEEDENDHASSGHSRQAESKKNWKAFVSPLAIAIEIAAIAAMAFFMLQEMFR